MKLKLGDSQRLAVGAALACGAILLPTVSLVLSAASASPAAVPRCAAATTEVWAASLGDGTAGTTYFELELSNVGSRTCTLRGAPQVWAVGKTGHEIGLSASHRGFSSPSMVTLQTGATSHAVLGVVDPYVLCNGPGLATAGLAVVPPGQARDQAQEVESFPLAVCPHQSSLNISPVHSGTGIPRYTYP